MDNLWEILVPYRWNNGNTIELPHHKAWDAVIIEIAGSQTIYKVIDGMWISPEDVLHKEPMIRAKIRCRLKEIKKIANFTIVHYNQKAVMFYKVSDECYIIRKTE